MFHTVNIAFCAEFKQFARSLTTILISSPLDKTRILCGGKELSLHRNDCYWRRIVRRTWRGRAIPAEQEHNCVTLKAYQEYQVWLWRLLAIPNCQKHSKSKSILCFVIFLQGFCIELCSLGITLCNNTIKFLGSIKANWSILVQFDNLRHHTDRMICV